MAAAPPRRTPSPPRARLRAAALTAAACAAALSPLPADAGRLHVSIEQLPCARRGELAKLVEDSASDLMARQPDQALIVERVDDGQVRMRLVGSGATYDSTIPFAESDCPELPHTVVLLLRSWLDRDWKPAPPPPVEQPPPRKPVLGLARKPTANDDAPRHTTFALVGGGFVPLGAGRMGPAVAASLDREVRPGFGVGVFVGAEGAVTELIGDSASVSAELWSLGALARTSVTPFQSARVDLLTGPALFVTTARSRGIDSSFARTLVDGGWTASARWHHEIMSHVALLASAEVRVRATQETLRVQNVGPVMTLGRARLLLGAGVAWEAF